MVGSVNGNKDLMLLSATYILFMAEIYTSNVKYTLQYSFCLFQVQCKYPATHMHLLPHVRQYIPTHNVHILGSRIWQTDKPQKTIVYRTNAARSYHLY